MKKLSIYSILILALTCSVNKTSAQTTGMDFNRPDCNGIMHHLFTNDLDSGNVVILEFFMGGGCTPCITAGQLLETMKTGLLAAHPGKIRAYASGFQDSYTCTTISNWVTSNGFTSTPIDSGATQVAYYGGFGMPTVVVLAGTRHNIIFSNVGFSTSDTTSIKNVVNSFFAGTLDVHNLAKADASIELFPNPANDLLNIGIDVKEQGLLNVQITDISGRIIATAVNEQVAAGTFHKAIDISALTPGLYIARVSVNGTTSFSKFTVTQ